MSTSSLRAAGITSIRGSAHSNFNVTKRFVLSNINSHRLSNCIESISYNLLIIISHHIRHQHHCTAPLLALSIICGLPGDIHSLPHCTHSSTSSAGVVAPKLFTTFINHIHAPASKRTTLLPTLLPG